MTTYVLPNLIGLTYPVGKKPQWTTDVYQSTTGKRTTNGRMIYPLYDYELAYTVLRSDIVNKEFQTLLAFFNLVGGQRDAWQFPDPDDGVATAQPFGTGDGTTATFQLARTITGLGGLAWSDPVFAPTAVTTVFVNGVAATPVTDYSVSTLGLVTFTGGHIPAAAAALTWTGTYNWWVRFVQDSAELSKFLNNFWELKKIAFTSEKI